jgi:hypothetical protein
MARNSAGSTQAPAKPRSWSIAVSAAYLRLTGSTQQQAAEAAGCSERTLRGWEAAEWWTDAAAEASDRWLEGVTASARRRLAVAAGQDAGLALRILERTDPRLAPPQMRVALSNVDYSELTNDELERIAAGEDPGTVLAGRRRR